MSDSIFLRQETAAGFVNRGGRFVPTLGGHLQADRWVGTGFFNLRPREEGATIGYQTDDEREAVPGRIRLRPEAVEGTIEQDGDFRPAPGGKALADRWVSDFSGVRDRPEIQLQLVRSNGFVDRGGTFRVRADGAMTYQRLVTPAFHNFRAATGTPEAPAPREAGHSPEPVDAGTIVLRTETVTGVVSGQVTPRFEPREGGDTLADRWVSEFRPAPVSAT